ncbi:MAG: phosphatidylserine decarboxylase family protein [Candidatus Stahlbacteria bacterium]|nr:phosphatidylserine decarboxylase family protein [Candidatus Stahlbacteria bacterium]
MVIKVVISSIGLAFIFLLPIAKKCEIRMKVAIIGTIVIGSLTAIATILLKGNIFIEIGFIVIFTAIIVLYRFYRDPPRTPLVAENVILSPADGVIRYIKKFNDLDTVFSINEGWIIGITMTYIDVHINRSPIDGRVVSVKHILGKFLSLKRDEALNENRRTIVVIENRSFKIGLILTASRLVRKILIWVKENEPVKAGQKIGKIVFGSQTDIIIPMLPELQINVKKGEQVYAGLTILAEYK